MTCDFTYFSTVVKSLQDDTWVVIKGCVKWNPVYEIVNGVPLHTAFQYHPHIVLI